MSTTSIAKAVILARGLGKRMRQHDTDADLDLAQAAAANAGIKAMVPVGRPFLDYVLSALADAGIKRACLVIGPEHSALRDYYQHLRTTRIAVTFAIQTDPLGTANAVLAAEEFAGADEFLVINSDNYYPVDVLQAMQQLGQTGTVLFEAGALVQHSNIPPDRIQAFASCVLDSAGFLADIVEKPADANFDPAKLVSMNCWRFGPGYFRRLSRRPYFSAQRIRTPACSKTRNSAWHEAEGGHPPKRCARSLAPHRHCRGHRALEERAGVAVNVSERLVASGMSETEARAKSKTFETLERHLPAGSKMYRWFVPGRLEVLGKHTDYAGGRSLLCTAERGFCVVAAPRADSVVRIHDIVRHKTVEFALSPDLAIPAYGWTVYPSVVTRRMARNFPGATVGADIVLASDLPSAAGMSSSSALVVTIFAVLSAVNHLAERNEYTTNITRAEDLAGYLGCNENGQTYKSLIGDGGVGTFGGSQDHTAILTSQPGHLKQYSFCPVRFERAVKLPDDCVFVIGVSGVVADKTGTAKASYNRASLAVRSILDIWRIASGSHSATLAAAATSSPSAPEQIRDALRRATSGDPVWLLKRFDQFLLESETLIPQASDALASGDLKTFGGLVDQSQEATERLLGNQVPETAWLADEARALGAHAASAFGAGFGGSVWALVSRCNAENFANHWRQAYHHSGHTVARHSQFFVTPAGPPMIQL